MKTTRRESYAKRRGPDAHSAAPRASSFIPRPSSLAPRPPPLVPFPSSPAFSLLEMIGVLAVMAILAAAITPNVVRQLDRSRVRAERDSLHALGSQIESYVRDTGSLPAHGSATADPRTWAITLASYSDLSAAQLTRNPRDVIRGYVADSTGNRAMLLSGMRNGLTVPSGTTINDTGFQQIWDTPDNQVPPASSWAGWSAWTGYGDSIVIERINVLALRRTFTAILNNADALGTTVSYRVRDLSGALGGPATVAPATQASVSSLRRGERVELYNNSGGSGTPTYTWVVSDHDVSLTYDSGFWR